jgi:hypothetical protein
MLKLRSWLFALLVLAIAATPVIAESNNAKTSNDNTANTASPEGSPAASPNPSPSPDPSPSPNPSPSINPSVGLAATDSNVTALLGVLVMKGVLAPTEANAIQNAAPGAQFQVLVEALSRKGVLNAADLSAAVKPATAAISVAAPEGMSSSLASAEAAQAQPPNPSRVAGELPPPSPAVIPAVVPVRVFPIDPPRPGGLAGIKEGPITIAPYGFIKATLVNDTSNPNGDDFPFPGIWLTSTSAFNTGPTEAPTFHVKARSTRFGVNFEWPDISPKLTLTGKIEGDFEGNFSEVDNRDVSSIRSNEPQLRLAYVRMDYHASENTDIFFVGGQDWTLFGSGALPNIVETTFLGAFWGDVYERSPQLLGGFIQTLSKEQNVKLEGQFGIMMPTSSQILKLGSLGLAAQLGEGEYEGADSDRPEWEGRAALSFQVDHAKGVAPAQIALSGFRGTRQSNIPFTSFATYSSTFCSAAATAAYCTAFPKGFTDSSHLYGGQITLQVPTRWFTLVGSAYRGGDLRFFFGGQINSYGTDVAGLTNVVGPFVTTDGGPYAVAGNALLGTNAAGQAVVAPQKAIRSFGGFLNLGLPLSRWFNADPKGHNAGWQLYFDIGKDQVVNRDLNNPSFASATLPMSMGKMFAATLYYKFNNWCQFGLEQSNYATRGKDGSLLYTIAGVPSNEWQDHRTEAGPIFTF